MNLDPNSLKLRPENVYLWRVIEKKPLSINVGGNKTLAVFTVGFKTKIPVAIHSGLSKKWETLFKTELPGIFFGFEVRF